MHKKAGTHGLVDIGVCTLHKVHNAFGVALDSTEWEIDAFVLDIYQGSNSLQQDAKTMSKSSNCRMFQNTHFCAMYSAVG